MKLKKVLAICLASAMTFSMAACGGGAAEATAPAAGEAAADDAEETDAADTEDEDTDEADAADAADESDIPTYTQLDLGKYGDAEATIKFLHHKTDRAEDGTMDKMVAAFNNEFPNITVEKSGRLSYHIFITISSGSKY